MTTSTLVDVDEDEQVIAVTNVMTGDFVVREVDGYPYLRATVVTRLRDEGLIEGFK